jgi:hypothetical protein
MLIIWQTHAVPYNMHNTDDRQDGYCLLYYVHEDSDVHGYEIIPYCLRSFDKALIVNINNTFDSKFTFNELREKNVSSKMLLSWSSSIDLAEEYEIFLNNLSYSSSLSVEKEMIFYNCSSPWFGPFCLFAFDPEMDVSFHQIVNFNFNLDPTILKYPSITCYVHLHCGRTPLCLDWREICDRKIDCLDGSDELNCWQLEINECSENEYRCRNGQCISAKFFYDDDNKMDLDCIDGTDEPRTKASQDCAQSPAFYCEENNCRHDEGFFPCGDGQCTNGMSNCRNYRDTLSFNDSCSKSMACMIIRYYIDGIDFQWCEKFCSNDSCVQDYCPSLYEFPSRPIAFEHVRFVYINKKFEEDRGIPLPDYVCYDEKLCEDLYPPTVLINGSTCRNLYEFGLNDIIVFGDLSYLSREVEKLFSKCLISLDETHYCNNSIMYQCFNSTKCISKHRLLDGIVDCPLNDDETFNGTCPFSNTTRRFNCPVGNITKCFSPVIIHDGKNDCSNGEDEIEAMGYNDKHIYFYTICDGIDDRRPQLIDGRNETDETDCENWPCNNTYTRCNGIWSCKDGADDINCPSSTCPLFEHRCVFPNDTSKVSCLPINRAGDGIIDCLGATDERIHCRYRVPGIGEEYFQCWNDTKCFHPMTNLCNSYEDCPFGDDEIFCSRSRFFFCSVFDQAPRTEVEQFICDFGNTSTRPIVFRLENMPTYPTQLTFNIISRNLSTERKIQLIENTPYVQNRRCNRGIPVQIRRKNNTNKNSCLCPPSYYGDECQYQNERVSLTLQIRVINDWRIVFTLIITLIDSERNIESYEQIEYLAFRDCRIKFHIYLLYSNRPKNPSKNYSTQIDLFDKVTFKHRASWIFPLQFLFLPVHRQSVLLEVPISDVEIVKECQPPCIHGKCLSYVNDPRSTFCQCLSGWSGIQCNIEYKCNCASNSQCIGKSICLCPIDQYGSRCYLQESLCHLNPCENGGRCITRYEHYLSSDRYSFMCVCPEQYRGDRCEQQRTIILIAFHETIDIPSWLFIHFIRAKDTDELIRTSVMKKIAYDQDSVTVYTSILFNLAFVQMLNKYYLIILREENIDFMNISTMINPSYRCKSIEELFNVTFAHRDLIKRIKSYHIPCKQQLELVCFYDDVYFCLCNLDRQANCFEFNHSMRYDCDGNNFCENGGECFVDDPKCPTSSMCICSSCYYGSKCQFSTRGSALQLDVILGYQIRPDIAISQQSTAVKAGISLSIITLILGLISSLLSFLTFKMKKTRDVGCGIYLLVSSIVSMIIMIVLSIKFWFLLGSQMGSIKNHSFVRIQCIVLDYFLRSLLSIGDWLGACVAIERTVNVLKGVHFNKTKSKQAAKWTILIVFILTMSTYIHDPIHRDLVDDLEEQRIWCVTKYSLSLQQFDLAINIIHFSLPFLINLVSAVIIIITKVIIRSSIHKNESYRKLLHDQLKFHKHLLISPFILFLLTLPRIIISFLSGCMKSARNPWLYLIGYFISFTPSMLTFVVFVLPSKTYKKEFVKSIKRCWKR